MPRPPRQDHPGAWHHVFHRGARHGATFVDDKDCLTFLDTLHEAVERFSLQVHAYALIPNHYHLLTCVPLGNLSDCMQHINGTYTQRINARHGWDGALFRGRFGSKLVADDAWLSHLLAYVHLNPVKAGLVNRPDEPSWTSHRAYLGLDAAPGWLSTSFMLDRFGDAAGLDDFVRDVHIGRAPWPDAMNTAEGWLRPARLLPVRRVAAHAMPALTPMTFEAVLDDVKRVTGLSTTTVLQVRRGPGGNPARRFLIWALRHEARMKHSAIGAHLKMSEGHVSRVLARFRQGDLGSPIADWQVAWRDASHPTRRS